MSPPSTLAYTLSALTALGGLTGYIRARSLPSLIAGLTVGSLYGLGAYRMQNKLPYGVELALLASAVLGGSSIPRAVRSGGRKVVPVGLSVGAVVGLGVFGNAWSGGRD